MPHYDLQLCKNGYLAKMEYSNKLSNFEKIYIPKNNIITQLNKTICIQYGVTLKQILIIIYENINLFSKLFNISTLKEFLDEAFSENKNENDDDDDDDDEQLNSLELEWDSFVEKYDNEILLVDYVLFTGRDKDGSRVGLEFSPVNTIMDLPIEINDIYRIRDVDSPYDFLFSSIKPMTLFNVLNSIIYEITFFGSIKKRQDKLNQLNQTVKNLKNGNLKTLTFDEVSKELEKHIEDNKKPCRICGEDTRCKCFDKPIDLCHTCFNKLGED